MPLLLLSEALVQVRLWCQLLLGHIFLHTDTPLQYKLMTTITKFRFPHIWMPLLLKTV